MAATRKPVGQRSETEEKVPTANVGDFWDVPEGAEVTGPTGTHTVTGGRFCLQAAGTYTTDSGDAVTAV